jgi:hypothetical protein
MDDPMEQARQEHERQMEQSTRWTVGEMSRAEQAQGLSREAMEKYAQAATEAAEARVAREKEALEELRAIRKGIDKLVAAQGLQND